MTSPTGAGMPSAEAIEDEIRPMSYEGADLTECVERIRALFVSAFEAKEREIAKLDEWLTHWQTKCQATRGVQLEETARADAAEAKLAQAVEANAKLRADLTMAAESEMAANCERCGAPLFVGEDFVSDPDGVAGCWYAVTDIQSKRDRPCFAHRVGKPEARARSASEHLTDRGEKR
jgi:hypothetical protein